MKLLSEADVRSLLDPDTAIASSAEAYVALSEGRGEIPQRSEILSPEVSGVIMVMPGLLRDRVFGLKVIALREPPEKGGPPLSVSMVLLFDAVTLAPLGLIASDYFTDYRTAAGIAAATDVLARPESRVHVVFGAGRLAEPSVRLVARVRPIERVLIVGRSPERVSALVATLQDDKSLGGCSIEASTRDEAVGQADIITTVTTSPEPVFDGRLLKPGTHINLGGAFLPTSREIDDHVAAVGQFFFDSKSACLARSGDIVIPVTSGVLTENRLRAEIGAVIARHMDGRRSENEITVFKSLGTAMQDLLLGSELAAKAPSEIGRDFDHIGRGVY